MAVLLASCDSLISSPRTSTTVVTETPVASVITSIVGTQSATLSSAESETTPTLSITKEASFWEILTPCRLMFPLMSMLCHLV